jgi:hypothetical protein
MNLTERRDAVKAKLEKAKKNHRSTQTLEREYRVLTAAVLAERLQRDRSIKKLPLKAYESCATASPQLWAIFCELKGRPNIPSEHWTTYDVMMSLLAHIEASGMGVGVTQLRH